MLSAGVPIEQVQGYLNHRSIGTTRLYARAIDRTIEQGAAITDPF
jgi:site-specific recombinase XerD